jgi:RNA polymerase sigma-70 factor (ECF subfamily)
MMATPAEQDLEAIFREHYRLVYKTACVVTGSPQDAEDVLQTIFLKLLKRAAPPEFHKNPKGYFYKAAVNVSLSTIRSRKRQVLTADFEALEPPQHPENSNADAFIATRLHEAIASLSPRTAEILILRYVHDYTESEIARLLGRTRGTIAVTLYRSRIRLRRLLRASSSGENS